MRRRYEGKYYKAVRKPLKDFISSFTSVLKNQGTQALQTFISGDIRTVELGQPLNRMYVELGWEKANVSLKALRALPKVRTKKINLGFNREWTAAILE
jgi:hypothetical protein